MKIERLLYMSSNGVPSFEIKRPACLEEVDMLPAIYFQSRRTEIPPTYSLLWNADGILTVFSESSPYTSELLRFVFIDTEWSADKIVLPFFACENQTSELEVLTFTPDGLSAIAPCQGKLLWVSFNVTPELFTDLQGEIRMDIYADCPPHTVAGKVRQHTYTDSGFWTIQVKA